MSSKTNEHSLESVRAQIIDIVDQFTDVKTSDITGESKLIQDLELDELDILEIIMFVEEDFDIDEISDDDWDIFESPEGEEKIKTIDDAAKLILRLLSEQQKKEAI